MKYFQIKLLIAALFICIGISACDIVEVDKVTNPNSPSSEAVLNNASSAQLQNLVNGLEVKHRDYLSGGLNWWALVGSFGRESYYIFASDPRSATEWLQYPSQPVPAEQNHSFWNSGSGYTDPYEAVRQANLLILSVNNTDAISDAQKNGYVGFAQTIKGYQLLIPLMHQYQNGIRIALPYTNPLEPGPFLNYDDALAKIREILDKGAGNLQNAGSSFDFTLSAGFAGYNTPAGMLQVNRAIAARAAIYAEDWQGALDALQGSFLNLTESTKEAMWEGPAHVFTGGLDLTNSLYYKPNIDDAQLIVVHPDVIADAEPGDLRVQNKFFLRDEPAVHPNIPYNESGLPPVDFPYQIALYDELTAPVPFIRNEELVLIYAEANAQLNNLAEAVDAINLVRNTWALGDFSSTSKSDIIDQILFERRYSLWMEGHRWIDMRRYGRLDQIDTSVDGGSVPTQIARPQGELDWEDYENK